MPDLRIMTLPSFHNVLLHKATHEHTPPSRLMQADLSDVGNDDTSDAGLYAVQSTPEQMTTPIISDASITGSYQTTATIGPTLPTSSNMFSSIIAAAQGALGLTPKQTGAMLLPKGATASQVPSWLLPVGLGAAAFLLLSGRKH